MTEPHDCWIALPRFKALNAVAMDYQDKGAIVLYAFAPLGEITRMHRRIPAIVEKDAHYLFVPVSIGDMECEIAAERGEAARLNDVGENIGAHLCAPISQFAQTARRDIGGKGGDQKRHDKRGSQEGPEQSPG